MNRSRGSLTSRPGTGAPPWTPGTAILLPCTTDEHQQRVELDADEPRRFAEPWPPEVGAHLACREADLAAIKVINHARKRDRIEAWYRAGLAAAAAAMNDWLDWYRQRIDAWDDRHDAIYSVGLIAAGDELVILDDPVNRAQMQTLPDYWRH